jgi:hypothetical protein
MRMDGKYMDQLDIYVAKVGSSTKLGVCHTLALYNVVVSGYLGRFTSAMGRSWLSAICFSALIRAPFDG